MSKKISIIERIRVKEEILLRAYAEITLAGKMTEFTEEVKRLRNKE